MPNLQRASKKSRATESIGEILASHDRIVEQYDGQLAMGLIDYDEHEQNLRNLRKYHAQKLKQLMKRKR